MSKTTKALAILGVVAGLGVAAMPLSSYAATDFDQVTVKLTVEDSISCEVTTEGQLVNLDTVENGTMTKVGNATVNIKTNNAQGYQVSIAAPADGEYKDKTAMEGTGENTETIVAGDPDAAKAEENGASTWGYSVTAPTGVVANEAFNDDAFLGLSTTAQNIATRTGSKTAEAGDDITLSFKAYISATQNPDTYTGYAEVTASSGQA